MLQIAETLSEDAVVVEEGLVSTHSLHNFLALRDTRSFFGLASGGIGFALAGAIGIHLAQPHRPLVAIIGDGSAMYSIQALWTAAHLDLPITYIICNNRSYRILKERLLTFTGKAATQHWTRSCRHSRRRLPMRGRTCSTSWFTTGFRTEPAYWHCQVEAAGGRVSR